MNKKYKINNQVSLNSIDIIKLTPGNMYWLDYNGIFLGCNQNMLDTIGLKSIDEYRGKTYEDLYEPNHIQAIKQIDRQVMDQNITISLEERAIKSDGTECYFYTTKRPLHDNTGKVIGLLGISQDITEHKKTFIELNKVKTQLDATLNGMRMIIATIAHELRTPLAAIKSITDGVSAYWPMLIDGYNAAKESHMPITIIRQEALTQLSQSIDNISTRVDHANTVINILITNTSYTLDPSSFTLCSINSIIKTALAMYPLNSIEKTIIDWEEINDFQIYGSAPLIIQVLFNLIKNALYFIQATNRGRISIWTEKKTIYNELHFKDTAAGIAEDTLPHIFEQFYTKNTAHGSGIGLAFTKMCLKEHGGDILCQSTEGQYTEFILQFPAQRK